MSLPSFIRDIVRTDGLLGKLTPTDPLDWELSRHIRDTDDATLAAAPITDAAMLTLVRGALLYAVDDLDGAHRIFQDDPSALGSYWHGMLHRREGDFDNARYWFRRAGRLGVFGALHEATSTLSADIARQPTWDPYLFTGLCEQAKFGAHEMMTTCLAVQRAEFETMLAYCWRKAVGTEG